ncbi:DUF805 domain-containing protein [Phenylobacterium sp.]|uniref:DUF805 domain-containing protein n=1 Tax=Phenylobacterium sp. TaxID=1871053 RepID=UPI0035B4C39A
MDWKFLFLTAEGRIRRRDFWIGFLIVTVASVVLNILPVLGQIIGLLLIWPQVCLGAKRLHDMGRTAWLMLVPFAVAVVCMTLAVTIAGAGFVAALVLGASQAGHAAAGSALAGLGAASAIMSLAMFAGLGFLLWVGLTPTEPNENRYGPVPPLPAGPDAPPPSGPPPSAPIVEG